MIKRILCIIGAMALTALGIGMTLAVLHHDPQARQFSNDDNGKSMFIERVDVLLEAEEDGSLTVDETLRFDLGSQAWRGLYKDIILANSERVVGVKVGKVEGDVTRPLLPGSGIKLGVGGAYGSYGYGVIKDPGRRLRIVWNVADTGINTYRVRYKLAGAVKNYRDASTLLWDVWGTGWESGVGELNVTAVFPGRIKLFHPRAGDLQSRVRNVRVRARAAAASVVNLPQQRQVQIRLAAAPLSGFGTQPTDIMPKLRAEQAAIDRRNAEQAQRSAELLDRKPYWFVFPALLGALIALLLVAISALTFGRDETKKISAGGSYQYPPEKIPPAIAGSIFASAPTDQLVSAVLLGFMQRDVFRVLPSETKKEDIAIRNLVGATTFDASKVAAWERPIADLLQSAIDKHPEHSPEFTKLKKYLDTSTAESKIKSFEALVKSESAKYGVVLPYRGRVRRSIIAVIASLIYAAAVVLVGIASDGGNAAVRYDNLLPALVLFGLAPVIFFAAVEGNAFYVLRDDQANRVRQWETYQDFFAKMDMSRQYPLTVEIWDEALQYAAAFGYAKKVITNMPRTDERGTPLASSDAVGLGWMASSPMAVGSLGSMTSGVSGVTGMSSSSSSGGGGFSGGGSGGGGGGGW